MGIENFKNNSNETNRQDEDISEFEDLKYDKNGRPFYARKEGSLTYQGVDISDELTGQIKDPAERIEELREKRVSEPNIEIVRTKEQDEEFSSLVRKYREESDAKYS